MQARSLARCQAGTIRHNRNLPGVLQLKDCFLRKIPALQHEEIRIQVQIYPAGQAKAGALSEGLAIKEYMKISFIRHMLLQNGPEKASLRTGQPYVSPNRILNSVRLFSPGSVVEGSSTARITNREPMPFPSRM